MKNCLRSGHGKNSHGKTNIYRCFKLSCNQPFLPQFEFLFEYYYEVMHVSRDYITSTLINLMPWKKVSQKFFATFRIKMHCRRRKTAGGGERVVETVNWAMPSQATSRTIMSTVHTFHTMVRVSSWTPTIWATEGLTPVIGEKRVTTQPFESLKRLCLVPFSVINDVIMTSLLLVKVTYTLATTWFYQTPYYSLKIFRLMCIWEKIGFWQ